MTNTINKIMHNGDEFKFDTSSVSWITTTQPTNPVEWAVYYDTTNDVVKVYDGTSWQVIASWWHDYSWETKTITSWVVELWLRTIVEPTSDFTLNAPSNLEDWMEYVLRCVNWGTAYTMTLWNHIDNVHYVDLTLTANWIDTFSFICVDWILEVQPWIVSRSFTAAENWTDLSVVTTWEKYTWDNKQDALTFWRNILEKWNSIDSISEMSWDWIIVDASSRWPSPKWFHIPSYKDRESLKKIMDSLNLTTWDDRKTNLHMPYVWFRRWVDSYLSWWQWDYWSSTPCSNIYNNYSTYSLYIKWTKVNISTSFDRISALSIRCFKDVYEFPTSTWTVINWTLWSAWIFRDQVNWLISITPDWSVWYTIMDKNLWATTVYNDWDTLTQNNKGNTYQRWNNYWFNSTSSTLSNTSSTQVDASNNWPLNPYSGDTFITWWSYWDWTSYHNNNLWWWENPINIINTEYIINVSSTAPAVWTANNVITFVIW